MKASESGYRVAVVGASSLLGKELIALLKERQFPLAQLLRFEADAEEPDLPIVDFREGVGSILAEGDLPMEELDFVFLATRPQPLPQFLRSSETSRCVVIDLASGHSETPAEAATPVLSIPAEDRRARGLETARVSQRFVSAHPATIVVSTLLVRLAARFPLRRAVAEVFLPASEMGPRAIEELQKQTVSLLSFQKIPRAVFGAQLAFNLLPRLHSASGETLTGIEQQVRRQLLEYLGDRAPMPALRLFQTAVFYALGCSLYLETDKPATPEALAAALKGPPVRVRKLSDEAPSQAEASGSGDILVDAIAPDPARPEGVWLWAVADNLRLAALNAVEIAERLLKRRAA